MTPPRCRTVDSPLGPLTLAGVGSTLTHLLMAGQAHEPDRCGWQRDDGAFADAAEQLAAYFAGELTEFDLDVRPAGTDFQRRVWTALRGIPYGQTRSYADIARRVGCPAGARAVGLANGRNPVGIVIPCHRVIGSTGRLTGYGGGLDRKQTLLELERAHAPGGAPLFG